MRISAVSQSFQSEFRKTDGTKRADKLPKSKDLRVDSSEISSKARRLNETKAQVETIAVQIAQQPEVRIEKVEEVQEKIKKGYYDSPEFIDALADKLITEFGITSTGV